jgi:hypothetical protein
MAKCPPSNIGDDLGGYVVEPLRLIAGVEPLRLIAGSAILEAAVIEGLGIAGAK